MIEALIGGYYGRISIVLKKVWEGEELTQAELDVYMSYGYVMQAKLSCVKAVKRVEDNS